MDAIIEKFSSYAQRTALIYKEEAYTYSDFVSKILQWQNSLNEIIPEGATVILNSGLSIQSISCFFALALNRNIIIPVTITTPDELKNKAAISGAEFIIRLNEDGSKIHPIDVGAIKSVLLHDILKEKHPGLILFSSGITGTPKGMVHDLMVLIRPFLVKKKKSVNFMAMLLFDHIGGLNTIFSALFSGAVLTIPADRTPFTICSEIERHHVEVLPASPTMLNLILISGAYQQFDLSSIRAITYGTEPMPEGLLIKLNQAFPRARFMQTFGTSETGISQITSKSSSSIKLRFNDPDTEYKIVDGELWIKSKTVIKGYLNADMHQFTVDGWFKTGDLAEIDEEGFFTISGRKNELINVGGLKVLPQEVESVLMEMPIIENCIVYGEKHPITGNIVVAKVQVREDVEKSNCSSQIRSYLRTRLDRYKVPVKIHIVDSIDYNDRYKKIRPL